MDILFYTVITVLVVAVSWAWANGIEYMHMNHPDYKGEDLLDEYPPKKEEWDDNKQHTEQDFK